MILCNLIFWLNWFHILLIFSLKLLTFSFHRLDYTIYGTIFFHHFLMMAVTLLGCSCFNFLAHHDIDSQILLFTETQAKEMGIHTEKLTISPIFINAPIVASVIFSMFPMHPIFPFGLPHLLDCFYFFNLLVRLYLYLRIFYLKSFRLWRMMEFLRINFSRFIHIMLIPMILMYIEVWLREMVIIWKIPVLMVIRIWIIMKMLIWEEILSLKVVWAWQG